MQQKEFIAKDGLCYTLTIQPSGEEIAVSRNHLPLGVIDLKKVVRGADEYYLITVLDLEKCKGLGIGEAALRFHQDTFHRKLTANGDIREGRHADESQLTRDGIGFIKKMRLKGVIEPVDFHDAFSDDD